ncbi:hypothetical protein ACTA71_001267 [Dictyostelium dimigraforme]
MKINKKINIQFYLVLFLIINNSLINSQQVDNSKKDRSGITNLINSYGSELFNILNWNKIDNNNLKVKEDDGIINKFSNYGNDILNYLNIGDKKEKQQQQKDNGLFSTFSNNIRSLFKFEKTKDKNEQGIFSNIIKNVKDFIKWEKSEDGDGNKNLFFQSSSFGYSPYSFFGIDINDVIPSPILNEISDLNSNYLKQFGLNNQTIQLLIEFRNTILFTITFIIFIFTTLIIYYLASIGNSIIISTIIAILTVFLWIIISLFFIIVIDHKKNQDQSLEL